MLLLLFTDLALKAVLAAVLGNGGGIAAAETGGAEAVLRVVRQLHHVLQAQIAQGVHADDLGDLLHGVVVGDKFAGVVDVGAVVAGGHEGRRADPHVDLLGPGPAQQVDGPAAGQKTFD